MFEDKRLIFGLLDTELDCYIGVFPADSEKMACQFLSALVEEDSGCGAFRHCDVYLLGDVSLDTGRLSARGPAPERIASLGSLLERYGTTHDDCGDGSDGFRSDGVDAVKSDG